MAIDVSIVIPAYNRADLLAQCLESLRGSIGVTWEAIVVDNGSPEDLTAVRERFPEVRWLRSETNIGYAAANNLGFEVATGRHRCFMNSDAEVYPDTLAGLVDYLERNSGVGAVSPCNVGPDGLPQPSISPEHTLAMAWLRDSGFHLLFPDARLFRDWLSSGFDYSRPQEVAHSQTTCLLVRGEAYAEVGDMDPQLFLFYNDVDWCRRLRRAGWGLVYLPEPKVLHHGSASVETVGWKERQLWRDRYRFYRKWCGPKGTLGVRFACLTRLKVRLLAQLLKGRPLKLGEIWREGLGLYRALGSAENAR